jgi:hypothetical protein
MSYEYDVYSMWCITSIYYHPFAVLPFFTRTEH